MKRLMAVQALCHQARHRAASRRRLVERDLVLDGDMNSGVHRLVRYGDAGAPMVRLDELRRFAFIEVEPFRRIGSFERVVLCLALIEEILFVLRREEVESVLTQRAAQLLESLPDFGWSLRSEERRVG